MSVLTEVPSGDGATIELYQDGSVAIRRDDWDDATLTEEEQQAVREAVQQVQGTP